MRILITGGAGFIRSNIVRYALDTYDNDEVVTLDALTCAESKDNPGDALEDSRPEFIKKFAIRNSSKTSCRMSIP